MHPLPVGAGFGFTAVAAVSFMVVLASGHLFSVTASYSPRRAACALPDCSVPDVTFSKMWMSREWQSTQGVTARLTIASN
jgi:hypothetical protein